MPTSKQPAHKIGFDGMSDVSGQTHTVRTEAKGVDAFYTGKNDPSLLQKNLSSKKELNKKIIAQWKKDRAERRKLEAKVNTHLDATAMRGLKAMVYGIQSTFDEYGFSQEDVIEQIVLDAYERWQANSDENSLLERFGVLVDGIGSTIE